MLLATLALVLALPASATLAKDHHRHHHHHHHCGNSQKHPGHHGKHGNGHHPGRGNAKSCGQGGNNGSGDDGDVAVSDVLFPWVKSGNFADNWLDGLGLAALGLIGALVTVYLFLGEFLPSMGGRAAYEELKVEIGALADRRDRQLVPREHYAKDDEEELTDKQREESARITEQLTAIIDQKEGEAKALRRHLFLMGFPTYLLLGGAFAVLFASNALQALLIGFGWTAVADRIGLNRTDNVKAKARDAATSTMVDEANTRLKKSEARRKNAEQALAESKKMADQLRVAWARQARGNKANEPEQTNE